MKGFLVVAGALVVLVALPSSSFAQFGWAKKAALKTGIAKEVPSDEAGAAETASVLFNGLGDGDTAIIETPLSIAEAKKAIVAEFTTLKARLEQDTASSLRTDWYGRHSCPAPISECRMQAQVELTPAPAGALVKVRVSLQKRKWMRPAMGTWGDNGPNGKQTAELANKLVAVLDGKKADQASLAATPPTPPSSVTGLRITTSEPKRVMLGQTRSQVEATLGPPEKIFDLGAKVTYVYDDVKVIFTNDKVSDIQ